MGKKIAPRLTVIYSKRPFANFRLLGENIYAENDSVLVDFRFTSTGFRLLDENICTERNIPSISSINRIIRDKADGTFQDYNLRLLEQVG